MIENLSIRNFKSVKSMDLECKRINLFIGKPNTGKSNILEVLGLLNYWQGTTYHLSDFLRFGSLQDLFYDDIIDNPVRISMDQYMLEMKYENDAFVCYNKRADQSEWVRRMGLSFGGDHISGGKSVIGHNIRYYKFKKYRRYLNQGLEYLAPPYGENLFSIVISKKENKRTFSDFFSEYGYKAVLKPQELAFEFTKLTEDILVSFPYILASDTLQHMIFYTFAINSNENSTLVFEEPESHAFPYYTKYLGEKIGLDEKNQYFIATHNPYILQSIVEKSKTDEINVFITYYEDFQTRVHRIKEDDLSTLLEYDPFFNIESFLNEG